MYIYMYIYIYIYIYIYKYIYICTYVQNPINLTSSELTDAERSLLKKGPAFCPVPKDINLQKVTDDMDKFENRESLFGMSKHRNVLTHFDLLHPVAVEQSNGFLLLQNSISNLFHRVFHLLLRILLILLTI